MGMETSSPSCRNNKQTPGEFSIMSAIYLPRNASGARLRDAENARRNRLEIVKAYSQGQISRREIFKWGLVTAGGLIAPIGGLSPFVKSARADSGGIPTGAPPSPLFGGTPFSQPLPLLEVLPPTPATLSQTGTGDESLLVSSLTPNARYESLQDPIPVPAVLGG